MLHKKLTLYLAVVGVTAATVMVAQLHREPPLPPPPIAPPANPYASSIAASGIVETLNENIAVGIPAAEVVAQIHVKVWDHVEAGQPVLTLDGRELTARLGVNEANVAVAVATVERVQDQLSRLVAVRDARAVSQEELRTKQHDVAVAQAQLTAARSQMAQTRVELDRLTVLAPRSGMVLQVNIRVGEYASATPKLAPVVLGDLKHLQVRAEVDEQNAMRLQPGQVATAFLKGDTSEPIALQFVRIEPYVIPKTSLTGGSTERVDTRVLQVIYAFDRPKGRMVYVGQQVDLFVRSDAPLMAILENSSTAATASASALRSDDKGQL